MPDRACTICGGPVPGRQASTCGSVHCLREKRRRYDAAVRSGALRPVPRGPYTPRNETLRDRLRRTVLQNPALREAVEALRQPAGLNR